LEHPQVRQAVVLAREEEPGEKRLVAYVVGEGLEGQELGGQATSGQHSRKPAMLLVSELREHLKSRLPEYMVPSAFLMLESLPLSANGKLDRKALPAPDWSVEASSEYAEPRTPVEEALCGIWSQVLGLGRIGVKEDFFDLGGHSLLGMRVVAQVREVFEVELPLRAVFEAPTVEALSQRIEQLQRAGAGVLLPALRAQSRPSQLPLSFAQERLWLVDQLEPVGSAYNIPLALRLEGPLDLEALELSFGELVRRHESLRTRFETHDGEAVQVIDAPGRFVLPRVDLSELEDTQRAREVARWRQEEARQGFDLRTGPLIRARVLRLSAQDHVVLLTVHHIVSDGWSQRILIGEVSALYQAFSQGRPSPLAELPVQYADYALWQRGWLQAEELQRQLGYWKERLGSGVAPLELPTDRPRPPVPSHQGASWSFALSTELTGGLKELARAEGVTLYMVLLGAFQVLLSRYSGQSDIVVGSPIAGRRHQQLEGLIGFFLNTLALRTDLRGNPQFRDVLQRVKEVTLGAYAHQDIPF